MEVEKVVKGVNTVIQVEVVQGERQIGPRECTVVTGIKVSVDIQKTLRQM